MTCNRRSLAVIIAALPLALAGCSFPADDQGFGSNLRSALQSQELTDQSDPTANSAYEMQRSMNRHYGGGVSSAALTPSLGQSSSSGQD